MVFSLSKHAKEELQRRQIPESFLENVLHHPEQIIEGFGGKKIYQSKVDFGRGKIYLLRVVVDDTMNPVVVITAYRTSKIEKYWRSE